MKPCQCSQSHFENKLNISEKGSDINTVAEKSSNTVDKNNLATLSPSNQKEVQSTQDHHSISVEKDNRLLSKRPLPTGSSMFL